MNEAHPASSDPAQDLPVDELDLSGNEDLSDLEPPRRRGRHPLVMLLVIVFSGLLVWLYWEDLTYFLQPNEPTDLGATVQFKERYEESPNFDAQLPHNAYVRLHGLSGMMTSANDGKWTFCKLAYAPVYVAAGEGLASEQERSKTLYLSVSGRLRRMALTSRYDQLQDYYRAQFGVSFENAYILEAEKRPGDFWWAPLLMGLFVAFIGVNVVLLGRSIARR